MTEKLPSSTFVALMGDLVDSEGARSRTALHAAFNDAVKRENDMPAAIASPLTITLGDEFQGLVCSFSAAIEIARRMRLRLLAQDVECRFAIGLVTLSSPLNTAAAWNMLGSGLAETRDHLNDKALTTAYRFYLPSPTDGIVARLMESVGRALTMTEQAWTARQREVAWGFLIEGHTVKTLHLQTKTTERNIYKILNAAHLDPYREWWDDLQIAAKHLDAEHCLS